MVMKIDDFVANVLKDIDAGVSKAKDHTHRSYSVGVTNNDGVSFDIAVTTTQTNSLDGEGKAKVGIIEVLGAGVGVKASDKTKKSEVSRIQFTIKVPAMTKEESDRYYDQVNAANMRNSNEW